MIENQKENHKRKVKETKEFIRGNCLSSLKKNKKKKTK